jgi:N-acetylmuramoyl-L-alanine amidase
MNYSKFFEHVSEVLQTPDCRPKREKEFSAIVIHHTAGTADTPSAWARIAEGVKAWLTSQDKNYVSAHFQINRNGDIIQLCDPALYEAFHAGVSEHWHQGFRKVVSDWNRYAVGIELVGDGNITAYSLEQYQSLIILVKEIVARYQVSVKNIVGHEEIAPGRKDDPGVLFDWDSFIRSVVAS